MDCRQFDAQVARLDAIKETAQSFVRVRLTRIEEYDLNLFEFDYDLTMMIFFLDPTGTKVYGRYGQRNGNNADDLQSLVGLDYVMKSVLTMHASAMPKFAPRTEATSRYVGDIQGARARGCFHCHNVRESLNRELRTKGQWTNDKAWHFPLPENVGMVLEVGRGNVVAEVKPQSPAAKAGLQKGDRLIVVGAVPIHSIADCQFALEHVPAKGECKVQWLRDGTPHDATLSLDDGWRRADVSWRPSMRNYVPGLYLSGTDLTAEERAKLGLTDKQLAFRQGDVGTKAKAAGFQTGDVILGVEGEALDAIVEDRDFSHWLQRRYLVGDAVRFEIIRDGMRMVLPVVMR